MRLCNVSARTFHAAVPTVHLFSVSHHELRIRTQRLLNGLFPSPLVWSYIILCSISSHLSSYFVFNLSYFVSCHFILSFTILFCPVSYHPIALCCFTFYCPSRPVSYRLLPRPISSFLSRFRPASPHFVLRHLVLSSVVLLVPPPSGTYLIGHCPVSSFPARLLSSCVAGGPETYVHGLEKLCG